MRLARLLASIAVLAACDNGGGASGLEIQLVNGGGGAPLPDTFGGELTVRVRQAGAEPIESSTDVVDGLFDLSVPIPSPTMPTTIHTVVTDDDGDVAYIGAAPTFAPYGEGVQVARIVMDEPGHCERIAMRGASSMNAVHLTHGRLGGAIVAWKSLAVVAGGVDLDDASVPGADWIDRVAWDIVAIGDVLPAPALGRTSAIDLEVDRSLFVGDRDLRQLVARTTTASREPLDVPITMHDGASAASAIVDLGDQGVAIVGGTATRAITWLSRDGMARPSTMLATARAAPAATWMGDGMLVVGGQAPGEPDAEWVPLDENGRQLSIDLPDARGGALVPAPSSQSVLWIAFSDTTGAPSPESVILSGCPIACAMTTGPAWPAPRAAAALLRIGSTLWIAGGETAAGPVPTVERVRFDGASALFDVSAELSFPRADATLMHHAAGIVLIAGGRDRDEDGNDRLRDDLELCFPPELDAI